MEGLAAGTLALAVDNIYVRTESHLYAFGKAFEAVRSFKPLTVAQRESILARTKQAAAKGEFEPFKISSIFDGTALHTEWLGEEPKRLTQLMP
jgi:hypothetical protein